jgi:translation initiation factor 1
MSVGGKEERVIQDAMARRTETRLVYSTGGEKPKASAPEPETRAPSAPSPGIRLRLERRAGNRQATLVTGLPGGPDEVAELARALKTACSTGGGFKDGVLELQGDHRGRIEELLAARGLKSKRAGG